MWLRRSLGALGASAMVLIGLVAYSLPASAAPQTKVLSPLFSGATNPNVDFTTSAICDGCYPDDLGPGPGSWAFGASVETTVSDVSYSDASTLSSSYDDSILRQGQTLPLTDTLTPIVGTMTATGNLDIQYGVYNDPSGGTNWQPAGTVTAASEPFTLTFACNMPLPGDPPASCSSGTVNVPVASLTIIPWLPALPPIPGLDLDLSVDVSVNATINGAGVTTLRSVQVLGGTGAQTAPLNFGGSSPSTADDSVHFPCTQPAGNDVQYSLSNIAYDPSVDLSTTTALNLSADITPYGIDAFSGDLGSVTTPSDGLSLPLTVPDQSIDLGPLAKNNIPPVADAGGPYSGSEGTPITFDGSGSSSVCGFPTLVWNFSDGGVAYGEFPQHTFPGSGTYSGMVTATDATGLTSTATFSVNVANLPPVVNAGPNVSAAWGVPVALNGSATDPGTADQSTLTYSWDFGDGTPSASGGRSVTHSYSTPGTYTATLTSCDQYAACSSANTTVVIRKRNVTASYLGAFSGTYNTGSKLTGSLTDEFGNPVPGRTVGFTYNGAPAATASTGPSGVASSAFTPTLAAGTYPTAMSFAGDSLYQAASATGSYTEGREATTVTYTGALKGGPNKVVTVSAVLADASGAPLAGRSVSFVLGTQKVSAVTNASGVATASITLNQKNGTYPLSATFTPAGSDAGDYTGSSASATFSLQSK